MTTSLSIWEELRRKRICVSENNEWLREQHRDNFEAYRRARQSEAEDWMQTRTYPKDYAKSYDVEEGIDLLAWFSTRVSKVEWQQSEEGRDMAEHHIVITKDWATPSDWIPLATVIQKLLAQTILHEWVCREPLIRSRYASEVIITNVLIATHPKSRYDVGSVSRAGIEQQVTLARERGDSVVYLLDKHSGFHNYFTADMTVLPTDKPDLSLNSLGGGHLISARGRCTVVGGFFGICLSHTLHELVTNHHRTLGSWPLHVELPSNAIYCNKKKNQNDITNIHDWVRPEYLDSQLLRNLSKRKFEFWIRQSLDGYLGLKCALSVYHENRTLFSFPKQCSCAQDCSLELHITGRLAF